MEPHRVVEARHHHLSGHHRHRMREHDGRRQEVIRQVRERALLGQIVRRQRRGRLDPVQPARLVRLAQEVILGAHGLQLDDRLLRGNRLCALRQPVGKLRRKLARAHQLFRLRHIDIERNLVLEALFLAMERQLHVENRLGALTRHDAAGREAAAVARQLHVVDHVDVAHAGEQEVAVQGMRPAPRLDRERRGLQPLAEDLAAEQGSIVVDLVDLAAEQVGVELLQLEDFM
jgi:hypothetical protein